MGSSAGWRSHFAIIDQYVLEFSSKKYASLEFQAWRICIALEGGGQLIIQRKSLAGGSCCRRANLTRSCWGAIALLVNADTMMGIPLFHLLTNPVMEIPAHNNYIGPWQPLGLVSDKVG